MTSGLRARHTSSTVEFSLLDDKRSPGECLLDLLAPGRSSARLKA
jgi:hypothetical protein